MIRFPENSFINCTNEGSINSITWDNQVNDETDLIYFI